MRWPAACSGWCFDWYAETIRVGAIDRGQHRITLAKPSLYGVKQGNPSPRRYRALNLLEELDQPGGFYLDHDAGALFFWPPAALEGARVVLSTLNSPVLALKDVEWVTLRGFTVEAGLGNGIEMSGGRSNAIVACLVYNDVRRVGIRVSGGVGRRVEDCDLHDTGTGGLIFCAIPCFRLRREPANTCRASLCPRRSIEDVPNSTLTVPD